MTWKYLELKGQAKIIWAKSELEYELSEGIHTYHMCKCGRKMCRTNLCVLCWDEEIKKLTSQVKSKEKKQ